MTKKQVVTGVVLVLILAASVLTVKLVRGKSSLSEPSMPFSKVLGNEKAKLQIVEFSDFQCPSCRQGQLVIKEIFSKFPDMLRLTFYHFPLVGHPLSPHAHQSAECANRSGGFWPYMDRLFRDQAVWSKTQEPLKVFLGYAKELNLDSESFAACLSKQEIWDYVTAEKKRGEALQVQATPTFFVNGKRVVGAKDLAAEAGKILSEITGKEVRLNVEELKPQVPSPKAPETQETPHAA